MSIQWVINGCAINALTFKEEHISEIIPEGHRRVTPWEKVQAGDQIASISGRVAWISPSEKEIGMPADKVGRIIIRKITSK